MSVSASIPATVQIRRGHLLGLIGVVAALAACVTCGGDRVRVRHRYVGSGVELDQRLGVAAGPATFTMTRKQIEGLSTMAPQTATFTMTRKQIEGLSTMAQQTGRHADPLMSMTPAQLAGVGLGTGYQLPNAQSSPTAAAVLASMSPETRRYTESVMNLTFEQLAAGAAGHP